MSDNCNIGDELDVKIEKIVPRGLGLAFAEKLTIFVPLSAPGDQVRVRLDHIKKRTAFGSIVEVKEPSSLRVKPPCLHFGSCGGCDFQQLDYPAQLEAKADIIRDCLHRIGKIEVDKIDMIISPQEFGYRSRAKWHLDPIEQTFGYFRRDSHEVIDVAECPILTPELQSALGKTRAALDWSTLWEDSAEIEAVSADDGGVSIFTREMPQQTSEITVNVAGEEFTFSAQSFFQANRFLVPKLIEAAIGDAAGATALDLYCGVGLFALPLARKFTNVIGVEDNGTAVAFARKNAARAGLKNIELRRSGVRRFLNECNVESTDLILIDPPRSGAEKGTIEKIAELKPKQISYVSCEPSILARDLRAFLDAGYRIDKITALDLFPQTHHVETVVRLSL
ncbi:MAG: class I SAM-dependent RNA methyltransferase [Pyrinomonadaceae bacterium]